MTSGAESRRLRLGIIVPSSNTVLEPLTQNLIASIPHTVANVSVHFARFRVTKIDLSGDSTSQFNNALMLEAALLLADAKVDIIGWSGTSAAWLGFVSDAVLCQNIKEATGIPATSSILAMRDILRGMDGPEVGIITPYLSEVNASICETFAKEGFLIPKERSCCSGLSTNFDFANVGDADLDKMMAEIVANGAKTVLIVCTNLAAARRVRIWEKTYQILVLDSVTSVVYDMLKQLDVPLLGLVDEWGSLFN